MQESQLDLSTTERQLLYDIRTEQRKTNELLSNIIVEIKANDLLPKLLETLCQIANGIEKKEVKNASLTTVTKSTKPKRGNINAKN